MQTLLDILSGVRRPELVRAPNGWPPGLEPKRRLRVPDRGHVLMPKHVDGLAVWTDPRYRSMLPDGMSAPDEARAALLMNPGFIAPLPDPSDEWFDRLGVDRTRWGRENPAYLLSAVAFEDGAGQSFGLARTLVVENALGFGSSQLLFHEESWLTEIEEFAEALANQVLDSVDLQPRPEGDGRPWSTVMLLLNDESKEEALPHGWRRSLQLVAGLYEVDLTIHANAWGTKARILHDLRTAPPNALLVSDRSISAPEVFLGTYRSARPDGYGQLLGSSGAVSFADHVVELGMHLREFVDLSRLGQGSLSTVSDESDEALDWDSGADKIRAMRGEHFVLSPRVERQLNGNPYPNPQRMVEQVEALANIARQYRDGAGDLGKRLEDVARDHGIVIALFDAGLAGKTVSIGDETYDSTPHVKVDDFTSPDKCGRVYFAIDKKNLRFIVDHIGLHDY